MSIGITNVGLTQHLGIKDCPYTYQTQNLASMRLRPLVKVAKLVRFEMGERDRRDEILPDLIRFLQMRGYVEGELEGQLPVQEAEEADDEIQRRINEVMEGRQ